MIQYSSNAANQPYIQQSRNVEVVIRYKTNAASERNSHDKSYKMIKNELKTTLST